MPSNCNEYHAWSQNFVSYVFNSEAMVDDISYTVKGCFNMYLSLITDWRTKFYK